MVQSAADGKRDQVDWTLNHLWTSRALRCVAVESLMGPSSMVVFLNIFSEQTVQVPFTENDDVIEQLSAKGPDQPGASSGKCC